MKWLVLLLLWPVAAWADPISITVALSTYIGTTAAVAVANAAAFIAANALAITVISANVIGTARQRIKARKAASAQRAAYNASLQDRSLTLLQANPPVRVVYGRCIVGGDIVAMFTTDKTGVRANGSTYTKPDAYKHLVIVVAAHEVQAINDILIDGVSIGPLDGSGWVTSGDFYTASKPAMREATIGGGGYVDVTPAVASLLGGFVQSGVGLEATYTPFTPTLSLGNTRISGPAGGTVNYYVNTSTAALRVSKFLGAPTQTVDTYLNSVAPSQWTSNHRLRGLAGIVVTLDLEEPRFQSGPPQITIDVSGKKIYDTRTATTAYSENPALIVRDFLTSPYGLSVNASEIDTTACNAAANACDARLSATVQSHAATFTADAATEQITCASDRWFATGDGVRLTTSGTLPGGLATATTYYVIANASRTVFSLATSIANAFAGTAINITSAGSGTHTVTWYDYAAYTCNGAFATDGSGKEAVIEDLVETMAGTATYGATWIIQAGAWTSPVMALTDDDLDGQIEIVQAGAGLDAIINGVRGQFVPTGKATPQDFQPYQNSTFLSADGQELWEDVSFPFVGNKVRCANLARIRVEQARDGLMVRYPAKLKAWPLQIGDRVTVTSTEYGWSAKAFRVTDWQFGASTAVILTLQEDAAAIYDLADAVTADPAPNTGLPNPWLVAAVSGVTATSGVSTVLKSGTNPLVPRVLVQWTAIADPYVADGAGRIEILWRRPGGTWQQTNVPGDATSAYLDGVDAGDLLTIEVRARNNLGQTGPSGFYAHTVSGTAAVGWTDVTSKPADSALLNSYVPTGINLIYNSAFEAGLDGWSEVESYGPYHAIGVNYNSTWRLLPATAPWTSVLWIEQLSAGTDDAHYFGRGSRRIAVKPDTRYMLSGYIQPNRCNGLVFARVYDSADSLIADAQGGGGHGDFSQANANSLDKFVRVYGAFTTGATAAYVVVYVRKGDTLTGGSSYLWATRMLLEEAPSATTPGAWSDAARQHQITSGNASTYVGGGAVGTPLVAGSAITQSVVTDSAGVAVYSGSSASMTSSIALGTITTSADGDGRVMLLFSPDQANSSEGRASPPYLGKGRIQVTLGGVGSTIYLRVKRNSTVIRTRSYAFTGNSDRYLLDANVVLFDTPGAGVTVTYYYEIYTVSSGSPTVNNYHEILPMTTALIELRK